MGESTFSSVFCFGIGATVFIFSRETNEKDEKIKVVTIEKPVVEPNRESLAQKNILDSLMSLKLAYDAAILEKRHCRNN